MFNNITIKARLYAMAALTCLTFALLGWITVHGTMQTLEETKGVYYGSVDAIQELYGIDDVINSNLILTLEKVRDGTLSWNKGEDILKAGLTTLQQHLDNYTRLFSTGIYRDSSIKLQALSKSTINEFSRAEEILRKQQNEQLVNFIAQDLPRNIEPLTEHLRGQIRAHISETEKDYQGAVESAHQTIFWSIFSIIVAAIVLLVSKFVVLKSITSPLEFAVGTLHKVSDGDITMQLEVKGKDEISKLMAEMKNMISATKTMIHVLTEIGNGNLAVNVPIRSEVDSFSKALQDMLLSTKKMTHVLAAVANGDLTVKVPIRSEVDSFGKALNHMVDRLKQITSEIQSEVYVLTNCTEEIVASVNQVSTGTAETAAAVAETTTTVEELKQTAHIAAEKAKDVMAIAEETLGTVRNSEKTLHVTIEEMNQIQEKMRFISESIVKLSEHSLAIGEIINTVNNLAEQSNLLAVNAAIEAAKAGEQGRSFGVVAQEIRTLAEQSKEATIQVRGILNDIQNATSSAVLATEQGSKAVIKGVEQAKLMSEAIHGLFTSISKVTQASNQISISSQQQLVGVDQVTVAMTNINEASSQHVGQMHQIEAAVQILNNVAVSLRNLMNQYKVSLEKKQTHRENLLDMSEGKSELHPELELHK